MSITAFKNLFAALSIACCLSASSVQAAVVFSDDFTGSPDAAWTVDRYTPNGFSTVNFDSDDRLQISISEAQADVNRGGQSGIFYNTQGKTVAVGSIPEWSVSADLFVSSDMVSGNNLRRTDLWARTGLVGNEAGAAYPIIGMRRFDPADPFNAGATNFSSAWRVWDSNTGWIELGAAVDEGWNSLAISGNATETKFYLNGALVHTDSTVSPALSQLTNVFLQGYNFNQAGVVPSQDYVAYWDNVVVNAVPEPASLGLAGIAAIGMIAVRRRQRLV